MQQQLNAICSVKLRVVITPLFLLEIGFEKFVFHRRPCVTEALVNNGRKVSVKIDVSNTYTHTDKLLKIIK